MAAPSTTLPSTTVSTTSTTVTTTTTTLRGAPVAAVGPDQEVARDAAVSLDGSASSDPDGQTLVYRWLQRGGPDVTGGTGVLEGVTPSFAAPADVSTVVFELVVSDGTLESAPATTRVWVMEDPARALFVDGDVGSDTSGDGSRGKPFASLPHAFAAVDEGAPEDVYVRSRAGGASYDYAGQTLALPDGTSLYGGFGDGWTRDVTGDRSRVVAGPVAVSLRHLTADVWLSGLEITAAVRPHDPQNVARAAVEATDSPLVTVWLSDNTLRATDVPAPAPGALFGGAASVGLRATGLGGLDLRRNVVVAGAAGAGGRGSDGAVGATGAAGTDVAAGSATGGGGGSGNVHAGSAGGKGGNGATTSFDAGQKGTDTPTGPGGGGGTFPFDHGGNATPCANDDFRWHGPSLLGTHGAGGGGQGEPAFGGIGASPGGSGGTGGAGFGGAGGGGGFANSGIDGGGGGGGGQGGGGGSGGGGASGGGPSIGVLVAIFSANALVTLRDNVITAAAGGEGGRGGDGGDPGPGGPGGDGGAGGTGALGLRGGNGGCGRAGTHGWSGGVGGGGGGGPSYALYVGTGVSAATITGNLLTSGPGGRGGQAGRYLFGPNLNGSPSAGAGGRSLPCFDLHVGALERVVCAAVASGDNTLVAGADGPPPEPE